MDNIQKRWTPYTNTISALGAKKLDFIFRERILVVLTYCPSGIFVHCPPFLGVNKTRLGYAPWSLHEQDGGREHFFSALFGLTGDSSPCFRKTGHRPFPKGFCQQKDIKKACRAYSLAFTFRDISRKPERANARSGGLSVYSSLGPILGQISGQVLEQILSQPMADRHWKIKQEVAREYMASPCQGAFHV